MMLGLPEIDNAILSDHWTVGFTSSLEFLEFSDLAGVKMNQYAKHLDQMSFHSKVTALIQTHKLDQLLYLDH